MIKSIILIIFSIFIIGCGNNQNDNNTSKDNNMQSEEIDYR